MMNEKWNGDGNENKKTDKSSNKRFYLTALAVFAAFIALVLAIGGLSVLEIFIAERMPEDELPEPMISLEKFYYARGMNFQFQMAVDGVREIRPILVWGVVHPSDPRFDPSYNELIFVHTEACAADFPDNVIAAWPWNIPAQRAIDRIHHFANRTAEELRIAHHARDIISIDNFGLTYPIVIADLVDNWEKVNELLWAFTYAEQMSGFGLGQHRRPVDAQTYEDE